MDLSPALPPLKVGEVSLAARSLGKAANVTSSAAFPLAHCPGRSQSKSADATSRVPGDVSTSAIRRVRRGKKSDGGSATLTDSSRDREIPESWQDELMREWRASLATEESAGDTWTPEVDIRAGGADFTVDEDFADLDAEKVQEAKRKVADLIRAGDRVEEEIEKLGQQGKLDKALLAVIKNRFKFALHENEKEVAQCMDLLYRRIQAEIEASAATPAMRLLNSMLHMRDDLTSAQEDWLHECRDMMRAAFVPESDPFSLIVPQGFDPTQASGPISFGSHGDDGLLLRIDFIREVDELLKEVEGALLPSIQELDMTSEGIASRLQVEEKLRLLSQVRELRDAAVLLKI